MLSVVVKHLLWLFLCFRNVYYSRKWSGLSLLFYLTNYIDVGREVVSAECLTKMLRLWFGWEGHFNLCPVSERRNTVVVSRYSTNAILSHYSYPFLWIRNSFIGAWISVGITLFILTIENGIELLFQSCFSCVKKRFLLFPLKKYRTLWLQQSLHMRASISGLISLVVFVTATCYVSNAAHIPRKNATSSSSQQTSLESQHLVAPNSTSLGNHIQLEPIHGK